MSARLSVGLRLGLSRHDSVVSSDARAVDVDRTAFEHDAGLDHLEAVAAPELLRDDVVEIEGAVLFAPRVEAPVERDLTWAGGRSSIRETVNENRAVVADPRVVGRQMKNIDRPQCTGRVLLGAAGGLEKCLAHLVDLFFVGDCEADGIEAGDFRNHVGIDRRDDVELAGPGVAIVRPCQEAPDVPRPFGRHPVAGQQSAMLR